MNTHIWLILQSLGWIQGPSTSTSSFGLSSNILSDKTKWYPEKYCQGATKSDPFFCTWCFLFYHLTYLSLINLPLINLPDQDSKIQTWAWIGAKDQYMVLEAIIWLQRLWLSFKDQNWVPEVEIGFQGPVMALQALLQINIIMLTFHFSSYKFHIKSKCM